MNSPLGWSATQCGQDVSSHLGNAEILAGTVMVIDGVGDLESLPKGAVCLLMIMLNREIQAVSDILERGPAS